MKSIIVALLLILTLTSYSYSTTLSFQTGNNVLIGQNNLITATATIGIDTVNLYINGALEATGTGTATLNANTLLAGTYNVLAKDTIDLTSQTSNLVENPVPSGVAFYVNITLLNLQTRDTGNPYQDQINFPSNSYKQYLAGNLINTKFFYFNGTLIKSWIQGNFSNTATDTPIWVNVNGISKSSGNANSITIYMGIGSTLNTNFFDGITTGASPNYTSNYGQYDTGNFVFTYYNNFKGNMLTNDISNTIPLSMNIVQNNGVTFFSNSLAGNAMYIMFNYNSINASATVEDYGTFNVPQNAANSKWGLVLASNTFNSMRSSAIKGVNFISRLSSPGQNALEIDQGASSLGSIAAPVNYPFNSIFKLGCNTNILVANVFSPISATLRLTPSPNTCQGYTGVFFQDAKTGNVATINWFRIRSFAPNDVMPISTNSPINIVPTSSIPTLTFGNGNVILYGTSDIMTATCTPSEDTCTVQQNGITLSTGTGSTTYNAGLLGVRSYSISANDLTSGSNSIANVLTINKVLSANVATFNFRNPATYLTLNSLSIQSHINANTPDYFNFTSLLWLNITAVLNSINNQLTANILENGIVINRLFTTTTTNAFTIANLANGIYNFTFKINGNSNYIGSQYTYTINVLAQNTIPPNTVTKTTRPINLSIQDYSMYELVGLLIGALAFAYMYINEKAEHLKMLWLWLVFTFTAFALVASTGVLTTDQYTNGNGNTITIFNYGAIAVNTNVLSVENIFTIIFLAFAFISLVGFLYTLYGVFKKGIGLPR